MIPLLDDQGRARFTPFTIAVIVVWIGAYAWAWGLSPEATEELETEIGIRAKFTKDALGWLLEPGGEKFKDGLMLGLLPAIAHPIVQPGAVSLLFNVTFFWVFGHRLEARAGTIRFALFSSLAIAAGAAGQLLVDDPRFHRISIGGSALVAATIAAYLVRHPRGRVTMLIPLVVVPVFTSMPALVLAMAWTAAQYDRVQRFLTLGTAKPLEYEALGIAALAGVFFSILLWPNKRARREAKAAPKAKDKTKVKRMSTPA